MTQALLLSETHNAGKSVGPWLATWLTCDRALMLVGLGFLLLLLPSGVAAWFDTRTLAGVGVWAKPMKFQFAVGTLLMTLAWFMPYASHAFRHGRARNWLVAAAIATALFEVGYITLQGALGQASHFNESDALHRSLYHLMGLGALTLSLCGGWLGLEIWRNPASGLPRVLHWSIALGLMLSCVLGVASGLTISIMGGPLVGEASASAPRLWLFGWSLGGGDLRVAHFIGVHAMQVLPALAWLWCRGGPGRDARSATRDGVAAVLLATAWLLFWSGSYALALLQFS